MRAAPPRMESTGRRRVSVPANSRVVEKHGVRQARSRGPLLIFSLPTTKLNSINLLLRIGVVNLKCRLDSPPNVTLRNTPIRALMSEPRPVECTP